MLETSDVDILLQFQHFFRRRKPLEKVENLSVSLKTSEMPSGYAKSLGKKSASPPIVWRQKY